MRTKKHPGSIGVVDTPDECEAKKADKGNRKFKAKFGRQRTHNEQMLIRPCGVFHARATMYGAEAVSNVLANSRPSASYRNAQLLVSSLSRLHSRFQLPTSRNTSYTIQTLTQSSKKTRTKINGRGLRTWVCASMSGPS
jgi:hypothetical protein